MTRSAALASVAILVLGVAAACLPAGTRGTRTPVPPGTSGGSGGPGGPGATPAVSSAGPSGPPTIIPPTPTPAPTGSMYTVARGDSLNTIAKKYGTTARSIAFWNRATYPSLDPDSPGYAPSRLAVGWTLVVFTGLVYDEDSGATVDPSGAVPAP